MDKIHPVLATEGDTIVIGLKEVEHPLLQRGILSLHFRPTLSQIFKNYFTLSYNSFLTNSMWSVDTIPRHDDFSFLPPFLSLSPSHKYSWKDSPEQRPVFLLTKHAEIQEKHGELPTNKLSQHRSYFFIFLLNQHLFRFFQKQYFKLLHLLGSVHYNKAKNNNFFIVTFVSLAFIGK